MGNSAIKVIHIITGLSTGGAERMLLKLLQSVDRNVFKPIVITLSSKGEIGLQIEKLGIKVIALEMSSRKIDFRKIFLLFKYVRLTRPSIVQTWMYHADLLGGLAARLSGVKHVIWGIRQSNLSAELNNRTTLKLVKLCALLSFWLPEKILCNSSVARSNHEAVGYSSRKMVVIPNGFNLDEFTAGSFDRGVICDEIGISKDIPIVGMVARFDPQKNHLGFLKAAKIIHKSRPDVHFLLVGNGVDTRNDILLQWIIENELREVVHLLGQRDDIPRMMFLLDLLVSSSHGESFPNVIGEAMACGIPCVVTDVGDCAEIVGNTGRVVNAGDMGKLAHSVLEMLQLSEKERDKLGQLARKRVETCYEISDIVSRYQNLYLETINGVA